MVQLHDIKIQRQIGDSKLEGDKLFEVRINDRYYQKGDLIRYQVVENSYTFINANSPVIKIDHPLNSKIFEITYVYSGPGVDTGYVVLGEQDVTEDFVNGTGKFENLQLLQWKPQEENNGK